MSVARWFWRWERYLLAFTAGATACFVGFALYNQARELHRIGVLERAVKEHAAPRERQALHRSIASAVTAIGDGRPLAISRYLATRHMVETWHHDMAYAAALLRAGEIASFNDLRRQLPFVAFSFRERDLHGLDLSGADLADVDLTKCRLSETNLHGADLCRAKLDGADLSGSDLTAARMEGANLSGANLSGVRGKGTVFTGAALDGATLAHVTALEGARFDDALLSQASMIGSRFPGAHFVRTNMLLASLIEADLTTVATFDRVDLTGASLSGARLDPGRCSSLWLTGATGLDGATAAALQARGSVLEARQVLDLVAPAISSGFAAQIAEDPALPANQRRPALLSMLKEYYLH